VLVDDRLVDQGPEGFGGRRHLSYLRAPRHRPLLTPPNNGKQKRNRANLKVALTLGAGH
jgi:hypothetical protein